MKQKSLLKTLLLLCALVVGSVSTWGQTSSIEINTTNSGVTGDYQDKEFDVDNITFKFTQWMKNTNIQAKKSTTNSLYNIDAIPGTITSIVVEQTGTARAITIYGGTSEKPTTQITSPSTAATMTFDFTGSEYNYFSLKTPGNACYFDKITINYTPSGVTPTYTVTYDANGGSGTMTDENSPYEADDEVTLLTNSFTAPEGKIWSSWSVKDASENIIPVSNNKFTMPARNVTVKAQWVDDPNAPQYEWVLANLADLSYDDIFVIVGTVSNTNYSMSNNSSSSPVASLVTIENGIITSKVTDDIKWTIDGNATNGYTFSPYSTTGYYLYCNTTAGSGSNTNLRVASEDNATRKLFIPDGTTLKTKDTYTARYWNVYASGPDWRGYVSNSTNTTITFYKRQQVSSVATPTFSVPSDIYYESQSVEISCETSGATIYYTTDGTEPTSSSTLYEGAISISETTTLKAIAIKDGESSNVASATYTIKLPLSTIPAIFEEATSTETNVNVTFGNWVVSGVSGKNAYVTDNNGNGFIIYKSNHGFAVNDKLSGTVSETPLILYNGSAEFTNLTASTTGLTVSNDGTITVVTDKTIADLGGVNTGAVITLNNLTYDGTNLSDGTNTIKPYNSLYSDMSFTSGKTYNVTGVYVQYGDTKEILPRSAEDIEEVAVQHEQYTLTVSNLVHVNAYVFAGDESEMLFEGEGSAQIYDATEVMISLDAEEGYVLQSLLVDGVEHKEDIDGGMYIFLMPTNNVTVTATAVETTTYTLASSITSGKHYVIAASTSTTTKAMGGKNSSKDYYDAVDASLDGTTLTVLPNSGIQEFVIYGPNAGGYYTIYDPVARGYLYASSSSSNDLSYQTTNDANGLWEIDFENKTVTAQGSNSRNLLRYNSSSPRFSCYASGQTAIQFYEKDGEATPTESRTLNEFGYATYCSQNALDFTNAEGVTAWAITDVNGENITFSQITGKVPAGTGMLLKGAANASVTMTSATGATALSSNLLIGTLAPLTINANEYFGLSGDTFVPVLAGTVPAGKALLPVPAVTTGSRLTFVFEDATGIATIENGMLTNDRYYNLSGQRVNNPKKGMYIVNGKKVVVK